MFDYICQDAQGNDMFDSDISIGLMPTGVRRRAEHCLFGTFVALLLANHVVQGKVANSLRF